MSTNFRSCVYHAHDDDLAEKLYTLGKKIGIKNATQRAKLDQALKYFKTMSEQQESDGGSLYVRTDIKNGIQKAIYMKDDYVDEEMVRRNNLLSPSVAIISVRHGQTSGSYDIEAFIPI